MFNDPLKVKVFEELLNVKLLEPLNTPFPLNWIDVLGFPGKLPPLDPVFTVIGNVLPSPLVNVIVLELTDAVIKNEPVAPVEVM
jgi:hypothetical protein